MKKLEKIDLSILIPIIIFALISIITISSASIYISKSLGNLALKQTMWYLIGTVIVFITLKIGNDYLYEHSKIFYIIGVIALVLLLLFATPINNSKCWFTIPGIGSIQPSEFMKLFIMLYLGVMINDFKNTYDIPTVKQEFIFILKTLLLMVFPVILTFMQPDTGSVIIYAVIYIFMMFASGIRLRWFLIAFLVIGLIIGTVLGLYFLNGNLFIKIFGTDLFYRLDRIFDWTSGSGLQLENALASIGTGGMLGHGYKNTPIYFPESGTDFIFAVYASNFGLVGSIILISLIIFFDIKLVLLMKRKIKNTDKFVLAGIIGMLLFQQVQNIGMTIGLLPITGITLPFISYGGSSLISYMVIVGIILNISKEKPSRYRYK